MKVVEHFFGLAKFALLLTPGVSAHTTITVHITSTLIPYITTVNPSDPTVWQTRLSTKEFFPGTVTVTRPHSCIDYLAPIYVPAPPPETTHVTTITHIERASTTITDPAFPTFTRYSVTTPSVTYTTNSTQTSYSCTNTVVQYIIYASTQVVTRTVAPVEVSVTETGLCLVTQIRYNPHPSQSLFSRSWNSYEDPRTSLRGNVTRVTSTQYSVLWTTKYVSLDTWVRTSTKCNYSTVTEKTTRTETRVLATSTVDCAATATTPTASTRGGFSTPTPTTTTTTTTTTARGVVTTSTTMRPYTTAGILNGSLTTLTGTEIIEVWAWTSTERVVVWVTTDFTSTVVAGGVCAVATTLGH
ncbi:hypothetical protein QBC42DRAFT_257162 [Cladorrhinum samala]|uniref:Uncharacterized protein n=1 Tax=Cladorrhinum samala TaxID=585594 RepID=A0AAV9H917_9PEZI|nr:hypothetical protein QBC42DRAFT_257162 [Cladorrhinum samala]